jgi:penicillin amidase
MILKDNRVNLDGKNGPVEIKRNEHGIPEIIARSYRDACYALGWVHANDRQLQMMVTKIILDGRASEKIAASAELVEADKFIRSLNLYPDIAEQKKLLDRDVLEGVDAYTAGVNRCLEDSGTVFELKFLKCAAEPWKMEDTMMLAKVFTYFGLTDVQGNMEKLIVQMVQNNIDEKRIRELFPYLTDEIDVELLKKVKLNPPLVPGAVQWLSRIPRFIGSNNWAVSGKHTESGMPILCGDPHLEVNRMPAIWHEVIIRLPGDTLMGFALPGTPCIVIGRNRNLAFSPTYSFMDMIDFRIEECRAGKYRRGTTWHLFDIRREVIKTKKGEEIKVDFYENELGILEGDPFVDGFYLIRQWSADRGCGAQELNGIFNIMKAKTVREGMRHYRELDAASFNFVMADTGGNIGYQMSGRLFNRPAGVSGLLPHPAWDRKYNNRGYVSKNRLPSLYNPKEGIIVTANQDLNYLGTSTPINLAMASYRAERIEQMLKKRKKVGTEYMKEIHYDLYSIQAEKLMKIILPLITDTKKGKILKEWDLHYKSDSVGATLFENVYGSMIETVFGDYGFGRDTVKYLFTETSIFNDYYGNFDNILLNKKSCWFKFGTRDDLLRGVISEGLKKRSPEYGKTRKIYFKHLLFADKIPSFFGFDYGPVELPGCRATITQGQIFKSAGRTTTFSPSCRIIADMADEYLHTNTTGGNCDRPFSKWYKNNNSDWLHGVYKKLS